MRELRGYQVEPFDGNRQMVAASAAVGRHANTIHLVTEVDITEPRRLIGEHRESTGETLSLTGYVVTCLARTMGEFPGFNSFRKGNRLIVLDDVTISVLFEREIDGESVPEPVGIRTVNRKTFRQVNDELRTVQQRSVQRLGSESGTAWIRYIPGFLLRVFIRMAAGNVGMQKRFGVVGVTAIGMFGSGPTWIVPLTSATVTVAVGAIARRVALIHDNPQEREHLCLTVSFDHEIVDGAPAARFTSRLGDLLSSGDEIRELMGAPTSMSQCDVVEETLEHEVR